MGGVLDVHGEASALHGGTVKEGDVHRFTAIHVALVELDTDGLHHVGMGVIDHLL